VLCGTSRERTAIFPEHMNSPPVLCGTIRERTAIFPEHMNSPLICVGFVLLNLILSIQNAFTQ
jgi:hypothetical protein